MPKKYGKTFQKDPAFSKTLGDTNIDEKVTMKDAHKNINSLSGQFEKTNVDYSEQLRRTTRSIDTTAKQQQKLVEKIRMRELSSSTEIKAVEKSVHQILGKLGYVVESIGKNASKMLVDTAKATKQHMAEYGRALSADFAINKTNFVAMSLAKTSPIFGYFVGKFMETTVFSHFSTLIKEKLGAAVSYVGNKIKDFWGRGTDALKEWFKSPKKWKELYKATGKILKFPFEKFGQLLAYTVKGIKFIAKLPFQAIGLAFKAITKTLGFLVKSLVKLPGMILKLAWNIVKLPFKLIGGAVGGVKSGYKSVGRKDQEKSRKRYEERYGKPGEIPKLAQGGYIKEGGVAELHPAEVVTPFGKLKDAFRRALVPMENSIVKELRGLRYAVVGMGEDIGASFKMALMKNKLFRGIAGVFQTMKSAYHVYKFFFGKRNKYSTMLSKNTNPQARMSDNIAILFTNSMLKYDIMIAHLRSIEEHLTGKKSNVPKVESWIRFEKAKTFWEGVGGFKGLAKTGAATAKGLFGLAKGKASSVYGSAKGKVSAMSGAGQEPGLEALNFFGGGEEKTSLFQSLKGRGKSFLDTAKGKAKTFKDFSKQGYQMAKANKGWSKSGKGKAGSIRDRLESVREFLVTPVVGAGVGLQAAGVDVVGGINQAQQFKNDFVQGAMAEWVALKEKRAPQMEQLRSGVAKVFEKTGLKSLYDKTKMKQEKKEKKKDRRNLKAIAEATSGTEVKLSMTRKAVKKTLSTIWVIVLMGWGIVKSIISKVALLPFKAVFGLFKIIGSINVLTLGKNLWKISKFVTKISWGLISNLALGLGKAALWIAKAPFKLVTYLPQIISGLGTVVKWFFKRIPLLAGALSVFMGAKDAIKMWRSAAEVHDLKPGQEATLSQKITAALGGFFGGTESGWEGAKKGVLKGAGMGAIVGSVVPGIGTAIGMIVGGIAGAFLGAVGGKNIAQTLQLVWDEVKSIAESAWKFIKLPFKIAGMLVKRGKDWVVEKYHGALKVIDETLGKYLDPIFKFIDPIITWVSDQITSVVKTIKGVINTVLAPFASVKEFFDKLGESSTTNVQEASKVAKENIEERKAGTKAAQEAALSWAAGKEVKLPAETAETVAKKASEKPKGSFPDRITSYAKEKTGMGKTKPSAAGPVPKGVSGSPEVIAQIPKPSKDTVDVVKSVTTPKSNVDYEHVNASFLENFKNMATEYYEKTKKKMGVNEGFRSYEEQVRMYETKPPGYAARPGTSRHGYGMAMDVDRVYLNEADQMGLLDKYGLIRPLSHEPWHLEAAKTVATAHEGISRTLRPGLVRVAQGEGIEFTGDKMPSSMAFNDILGKQSRGGGPAVAELAKTIGSSSEETTAKMAAFIDTSQKVFSFNISNNSIGGSGQRKMPGGSLPNDATMKKLIECDL